MSALVVALAALGGKIVKKSMLFLFCLSALLTLCACGSQKQDQDQVSYEKLPLQDNNPLEWTNQQIDDYFGQMLIDTPLARQIAYRIWLTFGLNGNLTGNFEGIENAPLDKLIDQAIFCTPAIDHSYYEEWQDNYQEHNIVSRTYKRAIQDGMVLGDIFYADDIETTLIALYGEYPIAGENYKDHFKDGDHLEYYPAEGLFLQRTERDSARKRPLILDVYNIGLSTVCDFIIVNYGSREDRVYHEVQYEVELNSENFAQETAWLDVMRFTFQQAPNDKRPLLQQVENLGKMQDYNYQFPLAFIYPDFPSQLPTPDPSLPDIVIDLKESGYRLILPGYWEGRYQIEYPINSRAESWGLFELYDDLNRTYFPSGDGFICGISFKALEEILAEQPQALAEGYEGECIIGTTEQYAFIYYLSQDLQYDFRNDILTQSYWELYEDIQMILEKFMKINGISTNPQLAFWGEPIRIYRHFP